MSDIYKEGAAVALGLGAETAESVSDQQRQDFKVAFFRTLYAYLYKITCTDRKWIDTIVEVISTCAKDGKTLDETLALLYAHARINGRGLKVRIH